MRARLILALSILLLPACSGKPVEEKKAATKEVAPPKEKLLSKKERAAARKAEREAEEARVEKEALGVFDELKLEFDEAISQWASSRKQIKDPQELQVHFDQRPCLDFADKFHEMAGKYPKTRAAISAWRMATKFGMGETKLDAGAALLETAKDQFGTPEAKESLDLLMAHAVGPAHKESLKTLLNLAQQEIESESSFEIIKSLATAPQGLQFTSEGALVVAGDPEYRTQAIKQLKLFIQEDIRSEKAAECLQLLYLYGADSSKRVAFQQMLQHHEQHERTLEMTRGLGEQVTPDNEALLKEIVERISGKTRATAMVALARFYANRRRTAAFHSSTGFEGVDEELVSYLKKEVDPAELSSLETMLETYVMEHDELVGVAKGELFAMQKLALGMKAPEIVGQDLKGNDIKLSSFQGKVVLVTFWGDWCGVCRTMYPQERTIVENLEGKPFAILGINSDPTSEEALQVVEDEHLNWQNIWDGPKDTDGSISQTWGIAKWPTTYLLDAQGVIRYENLRGDDLDRAIETLMKELGEEVKLGADKPESAQPIPDTESDQGTNEDETGDVEDPTKTGDSDGSKSKDGDSKSENTESELSAG